MEVIVMKVVRQEARSVDAGIVRAAVSPLASDGLNEALRLTIGLGAIRPGEAMLDAKLLAGGGEELGAVGGAAVGEQALDLDAVVLVEGDGLTKRFESAGDLLIREETGEGEAVKNVFHPWPP